MNLRLLSLLVIFLYAGGVSLAWAAAAMPKQNKAQQQKKMREQQIQQQRMQMQIKEMQMNVHVPAQVAPEEIKDIVTMDQLLEALSQSSRAWTLIIDHEAKVMVIEHFVQGFAQHGVTIQKPAAFYAQQIDGMSQSRPEMLNQPLPDLLQTLAVIEYDLNNGADKDTMAMKILGEKAFLQNKQRLGLTP